MYFEASSVISDVLKKKSSLKNSVYSSKVQNKKALYALSCETLRYFKPLLKIAADSGLVKDKAVKNNEALTAVLMFEHLLGKGVKGKYKVVLHKHKSAIHSCCERMKLEYGVTSLKEALQRLIPPDTCTAEILLPKYVRINTLVADRDATMRELQNTFTWQGVFQAEQDGNSVLHDSNRGCFYTDEHVPDLSVFHPSVELHSNQLYLSGKLIIQDKASCFPAYILNPPPGSTVIDCCAAPGNKTTHLAAIMKNQGKVYAFDKDPKRLATLQKLVKKAGATCIQAECRDFLTVNPHDEKYRAVKYVLVDPSCSGSGMANRQRQFTEEVDSHSTDRLEQLSRFQITILKHALSFPNVQRVVYSTCSVHEEENEAVVEEVLSQFGDSFDVKHVMPEWKHRGLEKYPHGVNCLRMSCETSYTNGFFVACFERKATQVHGIVRNSQTGISMEKRKRENDVQNRHKQVKERTNTIFSGLRATTKWNVIS